ncbi:MAG: hypothetical protein KC613_11715 [Myxococcales bacterium]|nr:hypothetical protein [Myxococcales bacterium]
MGPDDAVDGPGITAVIGFRGDGIAGNLGVTASPASLAALHPLQPSAALGRSDLSDWAGELANQLLGVVKHQLASHGLDTWTGTPVVLQVLAPNPKANLNDTLLCKLKPLEAVVWLELSGVDLDTLDLPTAVDQGLKSGDMIWF